MSNVGVNLIFAVSMAALAVVRPAQAATGYFSIRDEPKTCSTYYDNGSGSQPSTLPECERAAKALLLAGDVDATASPSGTGFPEGCYYTMPGVGMNQYADLKFDTTSGSQEACEDSSVFACMCVYTGNKCAFADASASSQQAPDNDTPCVCGDVVCDKESGFYCHADFNVCTRRKSPIDVYAAINSKHLLEDGSSKLLNPCVEVINDLSISAIRPSPMQREPMEDDSMISCKTGARSLGLTWATEEPLKQMKAGSLARCRHSEDNGGTLSVDAASCAGAGVKCICETVLEKCENDGGTKVNAGACVCGSNTCNSGNGLMCKASSSECFHPTCNATNGEEENSPVPCKCGNSVCDFTSGFICDSATNKCSHPECLNTHGFALNKVEPHYCSCGNTVCEGYEFKVCLASKSKCLNAEKYLIGCSFDEAGQPEVHKYRTGMCRCGDPSGPIGSTSVCSQETGYLCNNVTSTCTIPNYEFVEESGAQFDEDFDAAKTEHSESAAIGILTTLLVLAVVGFFWNNRHHKDAVINTVKAKANLPMLLKKQEIDGEEIVEGDAEWLVITDTKPVPGGAWFYYKASDDKLGPFTTEEFATLHRSGLINDTTKVTGSF